MSHNVSAVYDVFASPIKETVGFQGLQNCGWREAWERSDLGEWNPGATEGSGAYTVLLYDVWAVLIYIFSSKNLYLSTTNGLSFGQ
jgi:hypothetical protein